MKIALFVNDLQMGGAERLVKDLSMELNNSGINPIIIVGNNKGGLRTNFEDAQIPVHSLHVEISSAGIPESIRKLSSILSDIEPDLVHSHLPFSHVVSRFACALQSIRHVSTYHNVRGHKTLPKRLAERSTRPLSDRTICVSDGVRRSYPGSTNMDVIYNAIDVARFNKRVSACSRPTLPTEAEAASKVFLNVARCVEQKRQKDLIRAISHMNSDDVHLVIVGDGPRREELEKLVNNKGIGERVSIMGYVEDIEPYYKIADVFISASSNEGLPTTHIEAMAARLPIISTQIPGVTEIVEHGENGLLCSVKAPEELADAMELIQADKARSLGEKGFNIAKSKFSLDEIASQHYRLYREVCRS